MASMRKIYGSIKYMTDAAHHATGFHEHADRALELLRMTVEMLDANSIRHCLISGTLLGHVRHDDFIPWDDDIDLLVDSSILDKIPSLLKNKQLVFLRFKNDMMKVCFRHNPITIIKHVHREKLLDPSDHYSWPFVDLFIIHEASNEELLFFKRKWPKETILPFVPAVFRRTLPCYVPRDTHYFLTENFGGDYMTNFKPSIYDHRNERRIPGFIPRPRASSQEPSSKA